MHMQIAIISDTHLKKNLGQLDYLTAELQNIALLIHAGDYGAAWVLTYLKNHFVFMGVWGNNDDDTIKTTLPEKMLLEVGTYKIGVCHGHGVGKTALERAYETFIHDSVDIIIFGHSHQPIMSTKKKVLMLNPGSLTSKRKERWFSYILLTIDPNGLQANLIMKEATPPPH